MSTVRLPTVNRELHLPVWYQSQMTENPQTHYPISEHRHEYIHRNPVGATVPSRQLDADGDEYAQQKQTYFAGDVGASLSNLKSEHRIQYERHNNQDASVHQSTQFRTRKDMLRPAPSSVPLESSSVYRNYYYDHQSTRIAPVKPVPTTIQNSVQPKNENEERKDPTSIYRTDYLRPCENAGRTAESESGKLQQTQSITNQSAGSASIVTPLPNTAVNQGPTDYSGNFRNTGQFTRQLLPQPKYLKPRIPFGNRTSYEDTYITHPYSKEKMIQPSKAANELWAKKGHSFEQSSLYNSDFVEKKPIRCADDPVIRQNKLALAYACGPDPEIWQKDDQSSQPYRDYSRRVFYNTKAINENIM